MEDRVILVCSTAPDISGAKTIAKALIEQKLAACVSIMPGVQSTYRWEGQIEEAEEVNLLIKTVQTRYEEMASVLVSLHPYDVPEIVCLPVTDGLPAYLEWVMAETSQ